MIFPFPSGGFLGRGLKLTDPPMRGNDVIAWQYFLGITPDGTFGQNTQTKTVAFQKNMGLTADGIVGPVSFRSACLLLIEGAHEAVPDGLAQGMIEGESGYWMGASSPTYMKDGIRKADVGVAQFQTTLSDEGAVRRALNPPLAIVRLCDFLREGQAAYRTASYVRKHAAPERLSWWLAAGRWNAPAWTDIWAARGPKDPALQVLVRGTDGSLITREEWVRRYVASKIIYVEDWTV